MDSFPPYNQIDHPALPKSHLNSLLIILIITFLASGATLIVLRQIYQYDGDQVYIATQAALPSHKIFTQNTTHLTSVSNNTVDWKKYQNDEYGLEFSYPPILNDFKIVTDFFMPIDIGVDSDNAFGYLSVVLLPRKLDPNNIEDVYGKIPNPPKKNIGAKEWYFYMEGDAGCGGQVYITAYNDKILRVQFAVCESHTNEINIQDESFINTMLSTFKFTK